MRDKSEMEKVVPHTVGIQPSLWEEMLKAVKAGDYKSTSALVRIAVTELLHEEAGG